MAKGPFKMKGYSYPGTSPVRHEPYAAAHTKAEGAVRHDNTAEAHGKKTEDYYDGSRGKVTSLSGKKMSERDIEMGADSTSTKR